MPKRNRSERAAFEASVEGAKPKRPQGYIEYKPPGEASLRYKPFAELASRRPRRRDAVAAIQAYLGAIELGDGFTLVHDGDETAAEGKCGWAWWLDSEDTTSYVHEDLSIEYYGPGRPGGQECSG